MMSHWSIGVSITVKSVDFELMFTGFVQMILIKKEFVFRTPESSDFLFFDTNMHSMHMFLFLECFEHMCFEFQPMLFVINLFPATNQLAV